MSVNGAITTLTNAPGTGGTTFALATGTGAWFAAGPAIVYNASTTVPDKASIEAVTLGAPSGDSVTVTRAQQGHTALNLTAGAVLVQAITALDWDNLVALVATKLPALTDRGAWAATTAYAVGDVVTSSNVRYLCKTAHTSAASFAGTNWIAFGVDLSGTYAPLAATWATGAVYVVGQLVHNAGTLYRVTTAHTAGASFSAGNFTALTGTSSSGQITFSAAGDITVRTGTTKWPAPRALTITGVFLAVGTAPTGAAVVVDVNVNGTTIHTTQSNRAQVAAAATTGSTSTIEAGSVTAGQVISVDIDQVGSTLPGTDLTVVVAYA